MPIYLYECSKCKKSVELLFKIGDTNSPFPCDCGGTMYKRITTSSFVVKGGTPKFCGKPEGLAELDANIDELESRKAQNKKEKEQKELDNLTKKYFV